MITISMLNSFFHKMSVGYHSQIPLGKMFDAMKSAGLVAVQEDGTPWSGLLCGAEGRAVVPLADGDLNPTRYTFTLSWYKMPSGRYEVTPYVS